MRLGFALEASFVSLLGCSTGPDDFGRCAGGLTISVVQMNEPEFSWTPADCLVYEVVVLEDRTVDWVLGSVETTNTIRPPVRYGAPRPGTTSSGEGTQLIPGFYYTVRLWRLGDVNHVGPAGEQRFLWQGAQ